MVNLWEKKDKDYPKYEISFKNNKYSTTKQQDKEKQLEKLDLH
jgi:hypothetical protein